MMRRLAARLHARLFLRDGPETGVATLVTYAHAGVAIAAGVAVSLNGGSAGIAIVAAATTFVALMACLLHPVTLWLAAALGTTVAAVVVGAIGYLAGFAAWRELGGRLCGLLAAALAIALMVACYRGYLRIARQPVA